MKNEHYLCSAALGSVTVAMKAQRALAAAAIPSEIIKSERVGSQRGCIYGIGFSCVQENNVRALLDSAKISVKDWKSNK